MRNLNRANGIGLVPHSPLGRGLLTGRLLPGSLEAGDSRSTDSFPHLNGEALATNLVLVERIRSLAAAKGVTSGQFALAWVLA